MSSARIDPPENGSERDVLEGFLKWQRATMMMKLEGLDREHALRRLVPSENTLLGMVKHLAYVERYWFRWVLAGEEVTFPWTDVDPNAEWRFEPEESVESVVALYRVECEAAEGTAAAFTLESIAEREGNTVSLRWILVHMIEETARHVGQADILRELTDGVTGE